jgi:hypothetical protein
MALIATSSMAPARRPVIRLGFMLATLVALGLALLEVALRLAPSLVSGRLANAVFSTYHTHAGGIYFADRETRMRFMRPSIAARCYWNGYVWQHRTDAHGFRNAPGTTSDGLLLLGDSMIYGHGVDEEETVAHCLRSEHGRPAYNMGHVGDTLYQEYIRARLALARCRPEQLLLFVFLNDIEDMLVHRRPEQIVDPFELERLDYAALAARISEPERGELHEELRRLRVWRLFKGLRKARSRANPHHATDHPMIASIMDDQRFLPVADYYRRVLGDLATRARAQGVLFSVVLLDIGDEVNHTVVPRMISAQDRLHGLLTEIGGEHDFPVLSTREIYLGCSECFLPDDGHLTHEGHRRLAAFIDRELARPSAR